MCVCVYISQLLYKSICRHFKRYIERCLPLLKTVGTAVERRCCCLKSAISDIITRLQRWWETEFRVGKAPALLAQPDQSPFGTTGANVQLHHLYQRTAFFTRRRASWPCSWHLSSCSFSPLWAQSRLCARQRKDLLVKSVTQKCPALCHSVFFFFGSFHSYVWMLSRTAL